MRVVLLIDTDGDTVRRIGDLRNRVDDQAVIFFAVTRSNDIKSVTDIEERRQIVFVGGFTVLRNIFFCQLFGERVELCLPYVSVFALSRRVIWCS